MTNIVFTASILDWIGEFAPLSIVIAVLSFLNTIRQVTAKIHQGEAQRIRQILNEAGTTASILTWSHIDALIFSQERSIFEN